MFIDIREKFEKFQNTIKVTVHRRRFHSFWKEILEKF